MSDPVRVSSAQVRWFRQRRSGLVRRWADPVETARRLLGVQAQLAPAAGLAFWNRTSGCTTADLEHARLRARSLVRMWGQRNTVHMYDSADWPVLHTVLSGRRSLLESRFDKTGLLGDFRRVVRRIARRLEAGAQLTYEDVRSKKLQEGQDRWVVSYVVFMQLVRQGIACTGPDVGTRTSFVHREHWLPHLEWSPPGEEEAFTEVAWRYLGAYGPARPADFAFWLGATVTDARRAFESLGTRRAPVETELGRQWLRAGDLARLRDKPPPPSRWPVRLLYRFDPLLLGTKDKSWLIDEDHYKKVWRAAAHVSAVVLVAGRIAGTWRYDRKAAGLVVLVEPFAALSRTVERAVERQAKGVADFLGLPLADVRIADPA